VTIAARRLEPAELVVAKMRDVAANKAAEFEFVQLDASLTKNVIEFAERMQKKYGETGLYALILSHGGVPNASPRVETSEGHELYILENITSLIFSFLAACVISKYILSAKLIDVLRRGGGCIVSIKGAGVSNSLNVDNLELKNNKTITIFCKHHMRTQLTVATTLREAACNDIFAQEITKTGVPYYHLHPLVVRTSGIDRDQLNFPWYHLTKLLMWIMGTDPQMYAAVPTSIVLKRPEYYTVGYTGKEAPIKPGLKQEELKEKLMNWMKNATGIGLDG